MRRYHKFEDTLLSQEWLVIFEPNWHVDVRRSTSKRTHNYRPTSSKFQHVGGLHLEFLLKKNNSMV